MHRSQRLFLLPALAAALTLVGCDKGAEDSSDNSAPPTASIEPVADDAPVQTADLPIKEATGEPEVVITPVSNTKKLSFTVDGMHCGGCASYIQGELAELPGVANVVVSYEDGNAIVTPTDDDDAIDSDTVVKAVEDLGGEYHIRKAEG